LGRAAKAIISRRQDGIKPLERKNRGLKSLYFKFIVGKIGKKVRILGEGRKKTDLRP